LKLALIGFGSVGKSFAKLLERKRGEFPFSITGIHTARHGTAYRAGGLTIEPEFGPAAASIEEFLSRSGAETLVEITPLSPADGEPAISHIRTAFSLGMHAVTANKGPIAHAYRELRAEAARAGLQFRFESTVMDGAPVFNLVRRTLPGVTIHGFAGLLNSTANVAIAAMRRGRSLDEGIEEARRMGITEADPAFDIDGWDSAVKGAALANVLMDARVSPLDVDRRGIGRLTPERLHALRLKDKTVCLVTRGKRTAGGGVRLRVRAEVLDSSDLLAAPAGSSNLLLLHTDLMGTLGTVCLNPGVEQTAYGLFSDLVEITRQPEFAARVSAAMGGSKPGDPR
jgi:homoserine dehydrogenase